MNNNYDVIISGCGPAGSLLGYLLAQNNINTLILEKEVFPRKKICAGGIQHRTLNLIPFDVAGVIEKTIYGIYFSLANKDIIHKKNNSPIMYTVERAIFDDFLARKSSDSGCSINFEERLTDYGVFDDYVEVFTVKSRYKTKILVGADGIRGTVHSKLTGNKKIHKIIGYETDIENENNSFMVNDSRGNIFDFNDSVRLDFNGVKKGYGWVFPKNNRMSCGIGAPAANAVKAKKYFNLFLSEFYPGGNTAASVAKPISGSAQKTWREPVNAPEQPVVTKTHQSPAKSVYKQSRTVNHGFKIVAHGIPVRKNDTPYCGRRVLAVGDAACFGDGFTGEGLYNALKSSIIAAQCIKNALKNSDFMFYDYLKFIEADICRDIKISLMLTRVFYSSVFLFYNLLKKNDNYFYSCCRILRGERTYKEIAERLKVIRF